MFKHLFLILTLLLIFTGCSEKEIELGDYAKVAKEIKLSEDAKIAKNHLKEKGYEVISYEGNGKQEFSKADLLTFPVQQLWSVQYIEPDEYLNQEIETAKFTIKNHSLDELFKMGKTHVTVWLIESEVIGGWSYPISKDNDVMGPPFSLDGKTAEEIKGDYQNWLEEWTNKYGN
jgi:hypothetical protein